MEKLKKFQSLNVKKILIILIGIICLFFLIIQLNGSMNSIVRIIRGEEEPAKEETVESFSYVVYDNKDEENIKILITVNSESGIEYIECPNGNKINGNKKKKLAFDYSVIKEQNYKFKIKEFEKQELQEKDLKINNNAIENTSLEFNIVTDVDGYSAFATKKKFDLEGYNECYYKIGKNSSWVKGDKFYFFDYDLKQNNLIEENNTITVSVKVANSSNKNEVSISKKLENIVGTEQENATEIESESLIKAINQENLKTGKYKIKIKDKEEVYDVKLYNIEGNPNIITNTSIGVPEDVGTANSDAQNMIILKVNGNLTIDDGGTLISYGSSYGGSKGMMVYCTGTLTNNGTISMTARGAKANGQDVYLWKNGDEDYEYVPAIGAARRCCCNS